MPKKEPRKTPTTMKRRSNFIFPHFPPKKSLFKLLHIIASLSTLSSHWPALSCPASTQLIFLKELKVSCCCGYRPPKKDTSVCKDSLKYTPRLWLKLEIKEIKKETQNKKKQMKIREIVFGLYWRTAGDKISSGLRVCE